MIEDLKVCRVAALTAFKLIEAENKCKQHEIKWAFWNYMDTMRETEGWTYIETYRCYELAMTFRDFYYSNKNVMEEDLKKRITNR